MEVCYQLPVLPLDRPVPKHVLSRRGAISLSSSSALFGGPVPRQLSKRRGAISYDSLDQTALYIRLLDVRVRVQSGCDAETEERPRPYTHPCPNLRLLHAQHESQRARRRALSFQRHFHSSRCLQGKRGQIPLHLLDSEHSMQAKAMLKRVGSWNFNIFKFDRLTNGNSLIDLTFHLFNKYGLMELFQLDMLRLLHFLVLVQEDYHSQNPYHNSSHAADVTQAMYCYLQEPKLSESLTSCDILLGLLAAATHDLDHPGVNQAFLIKTDHHLAALYRNSSVLENHHWRSAVSLLRETGLLSHLPTENRLSLEKRLGSLILATDITRQNAYMCDFRAYLDRTDLNMGKAEHRHFILQMALKCADICNPCRPWTLCKQWSEKVTEEFFYQGDIERKYGLDMSPFCDRTTYTVAQIQNSFMRFVVEPLFVEWARFSDTQLSRTMLGHLTLNKARWSRQTQEGVRSTSSASPSARLPHGGQGS